MSKIAERRTVSWLEAIPTSPQALLHLLMRNVRNRMHRKQDDTSSEYLTIVFSGWFSPNLDPSSFSKLLRCSSTSTGNLLGHSIFVSVGRSVLPVSRCLLDLPEFAVGSLRRRYLGQRTMCSTKCLRKLWWVWIRIFLNFLFCCSWYELGVRSFPFRFSVEVTKCCLI